MADNVKKNIIFITKALWIGGIETALINLLNFIDYERFNVTLLVTEAILDLKDQVNPRCRLLVVDREKCVSFDQRYQYDNLYHLSEEPENPSTIHKLMMWTVPAIRWVENWCYIRYIRSLMKDEHFDTCVIYSDVVAETAIRTIRADQFLMFYHHGAMRHVYHDRVAYNKCKKIIAVSKNQAEELKRFVPEAAGKVIVIHNLTDVEGIRTKALLPTAEEFDPSKFNIVSVGRVSHEKGMDIAVRVCAKLVEDGFDNVRWWIVGGGPAMQEVHDVIEELNMDDYVITVGMQGNPYSYMWQADLYVQPSRFEGYPMAILEALVLGQPVISTDNDGAKEILKDEVNGLLRPADIGVIAEGVEMLLRNTEFAQGLKKNVREFDFEKQNLQYMHKLERLL